MFLSQKHHSAGEIKEKSFVFEMHDSVLSVTLWFFRLIGKSAPA